MLLFKKLATKTDEHPATLHPSDILGSIHVEWVEVETTSLVGAWRTQNQEIWRIFAKLLGYLVTIWCSWWNQNLSANCMTYPWHLQLQLVERNEVDQKTSATKNLLPCVMLWGSLTAWDFSCLRWWTDNCSATLCFSWGVEWKHDCMCITSLGIGCL